MKYFVFLFIFSLLVSVSYCQKKQSKPVSSQKNRITNCLCSYTYTQFGKYTFYRNGKFDYVQPKPYPLYKTGTWTYLGGNKVKINKTWLGKSEIVTVDQDCNIDWGY